MTITSRVALPLLCLILVSPLIPTGITPIRLDEIILFTLPILVFFNKSVREQPITMLRIECFFPLMMMSMFISILWGYSLGVTPYWRDFMEFPKLFIYWMAFHFATKYDFKTFKNKDFLIIASFCFLLALSVVQIMGYSRLCGLLERLYLFHETLVLSTGRVQGMCTNANMFAFFLVISFLFVLSFRIHIPIKRVERECTFLLIVILVSLLLTQSRQGFIGVLIGILYILFSNIKITKIGHLIYNRRALIIIIFLFICIGFLILLTPAYFNRFNSTFVPERGIDERLCIWQQGILKGFKSPIFGFGPSESPEDLEVAVGITGHLSRRARINLLLRGDIDPVLVKGGAHNEYIEMWDRQGLVGLVLFVFFFVTVYRKAKELLKRYPENRLVVAYSQGLCSSIIAVVLVTGMLTSYWRLNRNGTFLVLLMGGLWALENYAKRETNKNGNR